MAVFVGHRGGGGVELCSGTVIWGNATIQYYDGESLLELTLPMGSTEAHISAAKNSILYIKGAVPTEPYRSGLTLIYQQYNDAFFQVDSDFTIINN